MSLSNLTTISCVLTAVTWTILAAFLVVLMRFGAQGVMDIVGGLFNPKEEEKPKADGALTAQASRRTPSSGQSLRQRAQNLDFPAPNAAAGAAGLAATQFSAQSADGGFNGIQRPDVPQVRDTLGGFSAQSAAPSPYNTQQSQSLSQQGNTFGQSPQQQGGLQSPQMPSLRSRDTLGGNSFQQQNSNQQSLQGGYQQQQPNPNQQGFLPPNQQSLRGNNLQQQNPNQQQPLQGGFQGQPNPNQQGFPPPNQQSLRGNNFQQQNPNQQSLQGGYQQQQPNPNQQGFPPPNQQSLRGNNLQQQNPNQQSLQGGYQQQQPNPNQQGFPPPNPQQGQPPNQQGNLGQYRPTLRSRPDVNAPNAGGGRYGRDRRQGDDYDRIYDDGEGGGFGDVLGDFFG